MPDNLDPRITVMPDGSYFYSGSLLLAGNMTSNSDRQARVETDLIKGPCSVLNSDSEYEHFPASRVLRVRADRVGRRHNARVDVVAEHSRFDVLCNPYYENEYTKVKLHRKTDVTLLDCCSRLLQNWPRNWQPDGRGPVPVYFQNPHWDGNRYSYGGGGMVQGSHPRNHHRGYALLLTRYNPLHANIFDDGHKDTDYALVPISHGTMNKAEARRIRVHRNFSEEEYYDAYGEEYYNNNHFLGAVSPSNWIRNWFRIVCEIIVGIKSNGLYPDFELEDEFHIPFAWNISVSTTAPTIRSHVDHQH